MKTKTEKKYMMGGAWGFYALLWVILGSLCYTPSYSADTTIKIQSAVLKDIQILNDRFNNPDKVKDNELKEIYKKFNNHNVLIAPDMEGYSVYISGFGVLMNSTEKTAMQNDLSGAINSIGQGNKTVNVFDMLDISCLAYNEGNQDPINADTLRNEVCTEGINLYELYGVFRLLRVIKNWTTEIT
ncbi:MAG: hypothetical protein LBI37_00400 [Puniceicoccales bacterium]|jgi:hypothetical protein|nr:hypothetical protein [Puniceicoccales bacterium]